MNYTLILTNNDYCLQNYKYDYLILLLKINFNTIEMVTPAGNICVYSVWFNNYG